MKLAIGCDHGAYEEKAALVTYLKEKGYEVTDFGTFGPESVDYPDFVRPVAEAVSKKESDFGIVLCGTGIGASITANKYHGIRCALVYDPEIAKITREHNNTNVLAMGGRTTSIEVMKQIVDNWLETPFSNDQRHIRRIDKISEIEKEQGR